MPVASDPAFQNHCAAFFKSFSSPNSKELHAIGDKITSLNQRRKDSALELDVDGDAGVYARALTNVCYNRLFFVTENGRIGVGPKTMEAGDRVCIIPGASVPLVLRKSGICWRFVGDSYVHGMMDVSRTLLEGRGGNLATDDGQGRLYCELDAFGKLEEKMQWLHIE